MTFMDGFIERINDSVVNLEISGVRVQSVHMSPLTVLALISVSNVNNFTHGASLIRQNLVLQTAFGPVKVEVEPEMADDIFLLGIR